MVKALQRRRKSAGSERSEIRKNNKRKMIKIAKRTNQELVKLLKFAMESGTELSEMRLARVSCTRIAMRARMKASLTTKLVDTIPCILVRD